MALELNAGSPDVDGANAGTTGMTEGGTPKDVLSSILSFTQGIIPLLVAIAVLWYFGTALKQMFGLTSVKDEIVWGRNVYLYSGLEALAFAAAGFLFGREVNRQRAERAEQNASKAQQDADAARKAADAARKAAAIDAANGQALAASVRAVADAQAPAPGEFESSTSLAGRPDGRALRRIADSLFPAA